MHQIGRVIDANLNRAREAARVLEDLARFAIVDQLACAEAKDIRHGIGDLSRRFSAVLGSGWRQIDRDVDSDCGVDMKAPDEGVRSGMRDLVIANAARLTEALRVLEESSKVLSGGSKTREGIHDAPSGAEGADSGWESWRVPEQLRYRAYSLEQRLLKRLQTRVAAQWALCLLLTRSGCRLPWQEVLAQALAAGTDCIQVREKELDGAPLLSHCEDVLRMVRDLAPGVPVIINDRLDVALASGADGVHLGQDDLPVRAARRVAGSEFLIGCSTHDLIEAQRAVDSGADYCGVGMMFPSGTKERDISGSSYLREFALRFPSVPHLAIGGIGVGNLRQLTECGCRGVAVSSGICASEEPGRVVAELLAGLTTGTIS